MSQAHRPTWAPAMGRERKLGSGFMAMKDYSARTKLKFRQPGQTDASEVAKRDLKAELLRAEREALDKKRKAQGLPPLVDEVEKREPVGAITNGDSEEDEVARKRRKILEEAVELDKDDDDDEDEETNGKSGNGKGKGRAVDQDVDQEENDDDDDDSDEDSDEEDDTAALMAELNKIKRERAEEKERQEAEAAASASVSREAEIATGNPLLNLQAALGQTPSSPGSSVSGRTSTAGGSFAVKRRWDDDLIFKNQASGVDIDGKPKKEFVNDLLRTEFHRKFMQKFIK